MNVISSPNSILSVVDPSDIERTAPPIPAEPADRAVDLRNSIAGWLLQASHRIGAVALLATLGTWAMMYRIQNFHWPLVVAAGASDLGFCAALLGRMFIHHNAKLRSEADGVAIFNLVLFILAIYIMIFARLSVIRANAAEFFTPTEQQQP